MEIKLDTNHSVQKIMSDVSCNRFNFEDIWSLHPEGFHTLKIYGKEVQSPRWQQSFGVNYRYSGATMYGIPTHDLLKPYLEWCQRSVDQSLNGLLLNWYDADLKHYIGKHRDDTRDLIDTSPIITISLGATRTFRMRPYRGSGFIDIDLSHGDVLVIPSETNKNWTHEVPHFKRNSGRRISITCRAYQECFKIRELPSPGLIAPSHLQQ